MSSAANSPFDSKISLAFSNPIMEDSGIHSEGGAAEEAEVRKTKPSERKDEESAAMARWERHQRRRWQLRDFGGAKALAAVGVVVLLLVVLLVGLAVRHATQQEHLHLHQKQLTAKDQQLKLQKELLELQLLRADASLNETALRSDQLAVQRVLLETHKRSNESLSELLNRTSAALRNCQMGSYELHEKMWKMERERMEQQYMVNVLNTTAREAVLHATVQQQVIDLLKKANFTQHAIIAEKDAKLKEFEDQLSGKQDEVIAMNETIAELNGTIRVLNTQIELYNLTLDERDKAIEQYKEEQKIVRLVNSSQSAREAKSKTLEEKLEVMSKQLELTEKVIESERAFSNNLRETCHLAVEHMDKAARVERERREDIEQKLQALTGEQCYRQHCVPKE